MKLPSVGVDEAVQYVSRGFRALFGLKEGWLDRRDMVANNVALGIEYFEAGQWRDSIFRFKTAVFLAPDHAQAWEYLGRSYLAAGNKARAKKALKKAVALDPASSAQSMLAECE